MPQRSSTPLSGCPALSAGLLRIQPLEGSPTGDRIEVSLVNAGTKPVSLQGAALDYYGVWRNRQQPAPVFPKLMAYWLDKTRLLEIPGGSLLPAAHSFSETAAVVPPGGESHLSWQFDHSFYTRLEEASSVLPAPQLFYWSGDFRAVIQYRVGGDLECSLELKGVQPPQITLEYSGGSASIYTPFWLRAQVEAGDSLPEEIHLFVYDAGGRLVHWRRTAGGESACLFGGDPICQARRPYRDSWDIDNKPGSTLIAPGAYTLTVLLHSPSGSVLQVFPFRIMELRPAVLTAAAATPTITATRRPSATYPPGYKPPSITVAPPGLPDGSAFPAAPFTFTLTPTITLSPTITQTLTPANTPTVTKTATREPSPTPTFCQTPLEGGGCQ